jgi:membrane protease YdiL (CAAX protease family)
MALLVALPLTSGTVFLPDVITAEDKACVLVANLVAGLVAAPFEEIAWTAFVTHELSKRHGLLATGLVVGLPWSLSHSPLIAASSSSGVVPPAVDVAVMVSWLPPYRVLMVWAYNRTQSVLMAMLMHLPITAGGWLLVSSAMAGGVHDLILNLVLDAALWWLVAAVAATNRATRVRSTRCPVPGRR